MGDINAGKLVASDKFDAEDFFLYKNTFLNEEE